MWYIHTQKEYVKKHYQNVVYSHTERVCKKTLSKINSDKNI